jgi:hypothetical protein
MIIETVTQPQITIHDGNWVRRARSPEGGLQITRGARFVGSVWVVSQFPVVHLFTNILLSFLCVMCYLGNEDLRRHRVKIPPSLIIDTNLPRV